MSERQKNECAITDAVADVRVLVAVQSAATDSSAQLIDNRRMMLVDEDTFIAWQRACDHLCDSVREVSRVFYDEPKP